MKTDKANKLIREYIKRGYRSKEQVQAFVTGMADTLIALKGDGETIEHLEKVLELDSEELKKMFAL